MNREPKMKDFHPPQEGAGSKEHQKSFKDDNRTASIVEATSPLERRGQYERLNPDAVVDNKRYSVYVQAFEASTGSPYSRVEEPWIIHYKKYLDQLGIDKLFEEYGRVSRLSQSTKEFENEVRVCTQELVRKLINQHFAKLDLSRVYKDGLIFIPEKDVTISLSSNQGDKQKQIHIPCLKGIRTPEILTKHGYVIEYLAGARFTRLCSSTTADEAYDTCTEYLESLEVTELFNTDAICAAMLGQESALSNAEYSNLSSNIYPLLDSLTEMGYSPNEQVARNINQKLSVLGEEAKVDLEKEIGTVLGLMARRNIDPPQGVVLKILVKIAENPRIKEVLNRVMKKESAFWGREFNPIHDAKVLDLFETGSALMLDDVSVEHKIQWAEFVEKTKLSLDLTRCNDITSPDFPYFGGVSEDYGTGYTGIYFGVLGGFRNWGGNRCVVHNMPLKFVQRVMGSMLVIDADRLLFSPEDIKDSDDKHSNWIVNGSKISFEPVEITAEREVLPELPLLLYIPSDIFETFQKYFPGTGLTTKTITVKGVKIEAPFLVLPEIAKEQPLKYLALKDFYHFSNLTWEKA